METYTYKLVEDEHGNIQCGDKLYRFEETIKEDKKIPKKLEDIIKDGCIEAPNNFELMDKINEIIDYLKSKGE